MLAESWRHEIRPAVSEGVFAGLSDVVSIFSTADYSLDLEKGTRKMKARPHVHPIWEEALPEVQKLSMGRLVRVRRMGATEKAKRR